MPARTGCKIAAVITSGGYIFVLLIYIHMVWCQTVLPPSAKDVYYRDEIGNISTSHMHETDDGIELELRPRFPLFGGWKTNYYIGYNIPSYQYLYHSGV